MKCRGPTLNAPRDRSGREILNPASGRLSPKFAGKNGAPVSTTSVRARDARASQARSGTNNRPDAR